MKQKAILAFAALSLSAAAILSSCISIPKQGDKIPAGKIIVVGRLDPGLELTEFFGVKDKKALGLRAYFNSEEREIATAATAIQGYSDDDDYFVFVLPAKPKLYLFGFTYVPDVSFQDQLQLEFEFKDLSFSSPSGAQLLYIGDIRVGYGKDDEVKFSVDDGFEKAKARFKDYFKDASGSYAVPVKALLNGSPEIEATRITHRVYVRRVYY